MTMNINWYNYDDTFFQRFCNALLSLEISKSFVPFSAPGKDGGIDGSFVGTYDGKTGKWRFQDKFHKTARIEAYQALKTGLPNELNKLKDEDYFIILTNVALLPQERSNLIDLAKKHLSEIGKELVEFDVWDEAKIDTLYIRHPILRLWVEDGFTTSQVVSYQDYFGKRLAAGVDDPGTLGNDFIARDKDIALLSQFIYSNEQNIAVVSGEAGIGKTRLVIEFFQTILDKSDQWQALVLNTHRINFDRISFGLSGNRNIALLVDDAHGYSADVIADLRNLIRNPSQRKLKLILTGRQLLIDKALELIPTVEDRTIKQIPLIKLSPDETRDLFLRQSNIGQYRQYIPQLVTTSNGRPILIVALLRAIHENTPIPQIKDEDVLKDFVRDYFATVIRVVSEHTGASKLRLENLLHLICLLEPLPAADDEFYKKLAASSEVALADLQFFANALIREGLALRKYQFLLSPDYYSDIILATAEPQFAISAIAEFPSYVSNIILNLSAVDEAYVDKDKAGLGLDPILLIYVKQINNGCSAERLQDVMITIASITYQKPDFGKLAIAYFLQRLLDSNGSEILELIAQDISSRSINRKSLYGAIRGILHDLLFRTGYEQFVFDVVVAVNSLTNDNALFKATFAIGKRHIIHGYNFTQQYFFVQAAMQHVSNESTHANFVIEAFKDFLKLEFTESSLDPFKNGQINLTTFYLSSDPEVIKFREHVIRSLILLYHSSETDDIKKLVIHELIDIPRGISASTRTKSPYAGTSEVLTILEFIESVSTSMPLSANREVIDRLYWIKKWGTTEQIENKIATLNQKLQPRSLPEKILYLINNAETRIDYDYKKLTHHIEVEAKLAMEQYDATTIATSLAEVRKVQANHLEFIWAVNKALYDGLPDKAKLVYDLLWTIDRQYIYSYGSEFLSALRFRHNEQEFYRSKIQELEEQATFESLNVILYVYFRSDHQLSLDDITLIERIYNTHREKWQISFNLLMALQKINSVEHSTSDLIVNLFDICPQRAVDNFLNFNREADASLLKRLVLGHTSRFHLSFEIQHTISSLLEKGVISENELFQYFQKRFDNLQELIEDNKYGQYEFVPHENYNLFKGFDEEKKLNVFIRGLRWYVNGQFKGMANYYAKDLLEFFRPSKQLPKDLSDRYVQELASIKEPSELIRIAESLDVFESKNIQLIDLTIEILKNGTHFNESELQKLRSAAYLAITSVGVKSGAVGQAFPVDIELRKLVINWMKDHPEDTLANDFLSQVVKSIDEEIERSTDNDDSLW